MESEAAGECIQSNRYDPHELSSQHAFATLLSTYSFPAGKKYCFYESFSRYVIHRGTEWLLFKHSIFSATFMSLSKIINDLSETFGCYSRRTAPVTELSSAQNMGSSNIEASQFLVPLVANHFHLWICRGTCCKALHEAHSAFLLPKKKAGCVRHWKG